MILFHNGVSPWPCQLCSQMKLLCSIFAKRYFGNIFKNPLLYNISHRLPLLCIHSQFDVYFDSSKKSFLDLRHFGIGIFKWVVLQKLPQLSDTHFSQVLNKLKKKYWKWINLTPHGLPLVICILRVWIRRVYG